MRKLAACSLPAMAQYLLKPSPGRLESVSARFIAISPTREALIEAVYRSELDALAAEANDLLGTHPGFEAMRRWMDRYARFVANKRAMHDALRVALTPRMGAMSETRARIRCGDCWIC